MQTRDDFIRDYKLINGPYDEAAKRAWLLHTSQGGSSNLNLKRLIVDLQARIGALEAQLAARVSG